ncbi:hypothetical protein [Niveibacterium sp.]|uniref:hypothetical protein n=1 Tax=Niveibacterium sp. TaxID=2017444 RepID=UPI0035B3E480
MSLLLLIALGAATNEAAAKGAPPVEASAPLASADTPTATASEPLADASAPLPASDSAGAKPPRLAPLSDQTTTHNGAAMTLPKDVPVFLTIYRSPKLTEQIRTHLAAQGYQLAASEQEAVIKLELDGLFKAKRQTTGRTAKAMMGTLVENPRSFGSERGGSVDIIGGGSLMTAIVGQALMFASDVTGTRDAFNKGVAGDPDGVCATKCDQRKFNQVASVAVAYIRDGGRIEAGVMVSGVSDDLQPDTLFPQALNLMLADMGVPAFAIAFPEVARK